MENHIVVGKVSEMHNFLKKADEKVFTFLKSVLFQDILPIQAIKDIQKGIDAFVQSSYLLDGTSARFFWNPLKKILLFSYSSISRSKDKSINCFLYAEALIHQRDKVKAIEIVPLGHIKLESKNLDEFNKNAKYISAKAKTALITITKNFDDEKEIQKMMKQFESFY